MADYFTYFSVIVPLPDEAAKTYALSLHEQAVAKSERDEPLPAEFPAALSTVIEDWRFEASANDEGLWLHTTEGGVDAACAFIQQLLERIPFADHICLAWSNDCSKPRPGAFGGGAAFITAQNITSMTTGDWLHEQEAAHARNIQTQEKGEPR